MRHSLALQKNLGTFKDAKAQAQVRQNKFNETSTYHFKLHDRHEQAQMRRENRLKAIQNKSARQVSVQPNKLTITIKIEGNDHFY